MRQYQQTIQYDTDECTAERPQSRVPVDGPDAPIHERSVLLHMAAIAEGLRNPVVVLRCTLTN